jgi:catechol 2,3-dioxygenase-like lactoylglutathione lyase family enzyme
VKVEGTDFAVVFVTDYPRAVEFYGGTLGLEQSQNYGRIPGGEFETGNLTLQILDAAAVGREFAASGSPIAR